MPGLMTDYAAGAKAYATPEIIQTELEAQRAQTAEQQANAARTQQLTQLGGYQLKDLQALEALSQRQGQVPLGQSQGTPQTQLSGIAGRQPSQIQIPSSQGTSFQSITGLDLPQIAGIADTSSTDQYLQSQRDQQQFTELQTKLQSAQQRYNAVNFDPELKQKYKTALDEVKTEITTAQEKQAKQQTEMLKQSFNPLIAATDNYSWNLGRSNAAKQQANAAVAEAIRQNIPENQLERIRTDAYRGAYDALPATYDSKARNIQANIQQQLEGSKGRQEEIKSDAEYQKAQLDMQKTDLEMKKLKVETNKLQADLRGGKKEKEKDLTTEHGKWVTQSNTAFDNLGKATSRITELEEQIKFHQDIIEEGFNTPTAEEKTESERLATELKTAKANRDRMQRDLDYSNRQKDITEEMIKAKGLPVPKPEPKPDPEKQIEMGAKQAWGSYEPKVYEYRVSPEGKLQRKAK